MESAVTKHTILHGGILGFVALRRCWELGSFACRIQAMELRGESIMRQASPFHRMLLSVSNYKLSVADQQHRVVFVSCIEAPAERVTLLNWILSLQRNVLWTGVEAGKLQKISGANKRCWKHIEETSQPWRTVEKSEVSQAWDEAVYCTGECGNLHQKGCNNRQLQDH